MNSHQDTVIFYVDRFHTIEYYLRSFDFLQFSKLIVMSGGRKRLFEVNFESPTNDLLTELFDSYVKTDGHECSNLSATEISDSYCVVASFDSSDLMDALSIRLPIYILSDPLFSLTANNSAPSFGIAQLQKIRRLNERVKFLYPNKRTSFIGSDLLQHRSLRLPMTNEVVGLPGGDQMAEGIQAELIIVSNDERFSKSSADNRKKLENYAEKHDLQYLVVGTNLISSNGVDCGLSYENRSKRIRVLQSAKLVIWTGTRPVNDVDVWLHDALAVGLPILSCEKDDSIFLSASNAYKNGSFSSINRAIRKVKKKRLDASKFSSQSSRYRASFYGVGSERANLESHLLQQLKNINEANELEIKRVGIVCPEGIHSQSFILAKQIYGLLKIDIESSSSYSANDIELVLFVEASASELANEAVQGIVFRPYRWASASAEDSMAARKFMGQIDVSSNETSIFIEDYLKNSLDCSALLFVSDLLPGRLLNATSTLMLSYLGARGTSILYGLGNEILQGKVLEQNCDKADELVSVSPLSDNQHLDRSDLRERIVFNPFDFNYLFSESETPACSGSSERGGEFAVLFWEAIPALYFNTIADQVVELARYIESSQGLRLVIASINCQAFDAAVSRIVKNDSIPWLNSLSNSNKIEFRDKLSYSNRVRLIRDSSTYIHLQTGFESAFNLKVAKESKRSIIVANSQFNRLSLQNYESLIGHFSADFSSMSNDLKHVFNAPPRLINADSSETQSDNKEYEGGALLPLVEKWL